MRTQLSALIAIGLAATALAASPAIAKRASQDQEMAQTRALNNAQLQTTPVSARMRSNGNFASPLLRNRSDSAAAAGANMRRDPMPAQQLQQRK
jgi:hypothetical protein